jgi:hypothetical protein
LKIIVILADQIPKLMTGIIRSNNRRLIFSLVMLFSVSIARLWSQSDLVINEYAKVTARVDDYSVSVDDPSLFAQGNYVLLIQMKGVSINADNDAGYGLLLDKVGKPGEYEFSIVSSVIGNTIRFLSKIKKFDPSGFVLFVMVPLYNSVSFSDRLTCKQWDPIAGTGGVLAMIVGKTLTLNNDIDVSGKGFIGAPAVAGDGLCAYPDGIGDTYSFPASYTNAGVKGEGIASHYTPYLGANPVL